MATDFPLLAVFAASAVGAAIMPHVVILSFGIPFALVLITRTRNIMGAFANRDDGRSPRLSLTP